MRIDLRAWSETSATLTVEQAVAIKATGLAVAEPEAAAGRWTLRGNSRVGVLRLDDGLELRVLPRLEIPKLLFLLSYAADAAGWRDVGPDYEADVDVFAAVASAFVAHAERATSPAPIRGYRTVEESAVVVRGRIRIGDHMARRAGVPLPIEVAYDEFTLDVDENRIVLGAAELLLRMPLVQLGVRRRLLRLRARLDGVEPTRPGLGVRAPSTTRLNGRYAGATKLAELVLRRASVDTVPGAVGGVQFSFDMNQVFEEFLTTALGVALRPFEGRLVAQYRTHLDHQSRIPMRPDLTWWRGARCRAVIDAKYKALENDRFPNADAYQMLAYCSALGLDEGFLVYAKDAGTRRADHDVVGTVVTVRVRAVDLEQPAERVLEQVERLAGRIALMPAPA